jgi:quercetin dioxygenase-like cupin family protein
MKRTGMMMMALVVLSACLSAQSDHFSSRVLFSGKATVRNSKGKTQTLRVDIRRLGLDADNEGQSISAATFSVMTVYSGRIETTIDGRTAVRSAGDYWTVKAGSVMRAKVLGESAVLQTIAVNP